MSVSTSRRAAFVIVGVIVLLDQVTKVLVRSQMPLGKIIKLFDGEFLWLWHITNSGMAFGIRIIPPWGLKIIALLAVIALGVFIYRHLPQGVLGRIPFAFVMGGALGNLIDRVLFGEVTDFISVDFPDFIMTRWPIFNIADSAINVGVALLLINMLFLHKSNSNLIQATEPSPLDYTTLDQEVKESV